MSNPGPKVHVTDCTITGIYIVQDSVYPVLLGLNSVKCGLIDVNIKTSDTHVVTVQRFFHGLDVSSNVHIKEAFKPNLGQPGVGTFCNEAGPVRVSHGVGVIYCLFQSFFLHDPCHCGTLVLIQRVFQIHQRVYFLL